MTTNRRARSKDGPADDAGSVAVADAGPLTVDEVGEAEQRAHARQAAETAQHRRRVQFGEYGQWVAAYDLKDDTHALVYAAGHPIPVNNVDEVTGAVVLTRHRCHHNPDVRCDEFNAPVMWSEDGAAVRPPHWEEPAAAEDQGDTADVPADPDAAEQDGAAE